MIYKVYRIVKSSRKITIPIAVFIIVVLTAHHRPMVPSINEKVDLYFQKQLVIVKKQIETLNNSVRKKSSKKLLQQQFISARLAYKKMAVLSEYFNIYETKFINGPALPRSEDGTPDIIIPPQGLQAVEEFLFSKDRTLSYEAIEKLLSDLITVLNRIENEPDRVYKFKIEMVWDAIRSSTIRLTTLGITGFDSPIALQSLSEARASIDGIKHILLLVAPEIKSEKKGPVDVLLDKLNKASVYLKSHNNFNTFDRLLFITEYINPVYKQLVKTRIDANITIPEGRNPVNFNATSLFQQDFFDINFFSPSQEYRMTDKRIELGKKLFFDPVLSGNKDRSCTSCHDPRKAFTDGITAPYALDNKTMLTRNTPTLWNSALQTRQFYDVRTDILENQLKEVVHNTDEMKGSLKESVSDLKQSPQYVALFSDAYAEEREPINAYNIANAISSYIRSLIALRSPFDQYMLGDKTKLSVSQKNGFNLFAGKAKCATCHFIPLFNGLVPPEFSETETEVLGVPASKSKTSAKLDNDEGKFAITTSIIHKSSFKTPTLRNVELTGPYMHNGVFTTLEEVMDFYNEGGGAGLHIAPENQTLPKEKLNLTKKEITDIIAFLKSLTDPAVKEYK